MKPFFVYLDSRFKARLLAFNTRPPTLRASLAEGSGEDYYDGNAHARVFAAEPNRRGSVENERH